MDIDSHPDLTSFIYRMDDYSYKICKFAQSIDNHVWLPHLLDEQS